MKLIFILLLNTLSLFALQTSDKTYECTQIFQERKEELILELDRIDEQRQALDALKIATDELLNTKQVKVDKKISEVLEKEQLILAKEKKIKKLLEENQAVLKEIKELKMDKVAQTFSKMKPGSAATILNGMDTNQSVKILSSLKPKTVGKILSKMDPSKASTITVELTTFKQ